MMVSNPPPLETGKKGGSKSNDDPFKSPFGDKPFRMMEMAQGAGRKAKRMKLRAQSAERRVENVSALRDILFFHEGI